MPLSTSDTIIFRDGEITNYAAPTMEITFRINTLGDGTAVVRVLDADGAQKEVIEYDFLKADLNTEDSDYNSHVATVMATIEALVKSKLETFNPSATITAS